MKERIFYQAYDGSAPYIFLAFDKKDRKAASDIVNGLVDRQFRICYDEHDSKDIADSGRLANRISSSALTVFLISADALGSLEFRNCISYALSKKKKVFCIYLDDEKLDEGTRMLLVNVPGVKLSGYKNTNELCDDIVKTDFFIQDMRGEDAKTEIKNNRKKKVAIVTMAAVLTLFFAFAAVITVYRVNYENSLAGQIEKMTEMDYLDISNEDASTIELLKGKTVTTLVARNMGLTDIEALRYADCEEIDLSGNPTVNTLEPLLDNKNLKIVAVTQDMYPAITRISGRHAFKIVITG